VSVEVLKHYVCVFSLPGGDIGCVLIFYNMHHGTAVGRRNRWRSTEAEKLDWFVFPYFYNVTGKHFSERRRSKAVFLTLGAESIQSLSVWMWRFELQSIIPWCWWTVECVKWLLHIFYVICKTEIPNWYFMFHCFTVHFNSLYIMFHLMHLFVIKH
jgi:hypothetical protein